MSASGSGTGTVVRAPYRSARLGVYSIILSVLLSMVVLEEEAEARRRGGARRPRGQARGARAAARRRGGGGQRRRQAQVNNDINNLNNNEFFELQNSAAAGNFFVNPVIVDPFGIGDARFSRNVVLVNGVPTVLNSGSILNGQVINPAFGDPLVQRRNGQVLPGISANGNALGTAVNADIQAINSRGDQ